MVSPLDVKAKELLDGMEGVTPGPWVPETEADTDDKDGQPEVYVCSPATACDYSVVATMGRAEAIEQATKQADAAHIARCSPDNLRPILETFTAQAARIAELERDMQEFMDRLDARWFLEQNWFPRALSKEQADG